MSVTIASYNVNGIRAAMRKGMADWFAEHPVEVLCLQETKAQPDQVKKEEAQLREIGFSHAYWHSAEKKGYSGVATLSRRPADLVSEGCGIEKYDAEGRILRTDFGELTLLNCYFPSGTTGDVRQAFKMEFLDDFFKWVQELRKERPNLVIVGDYNIAHNESDIHDPVRNKKTSGFLPEERAWMDKWLESGFVDAFRHLNPGKEEYSWWTYRANARANNKGWRLDYHSVSNAFASRLEACYQMTDAVHSDHCPVIATYNL
ncbi:exodeoxyribonuclease III [Phaeodactylibacter xiamenensis]|uniref:Exodeoxyribonuclease III n=1 Tax=Phaeodactylibacter xiamenensis TaxID=1524460 RepID=A0A098S826_9BACT|nr:exodeoxyribonuclease III [Phaeodactylibacter xiamenensis]KGE88255.1 exodeoxyribonuclease III [Phaeodactylibacter xiamenensis]MCR9051033.1 exodeoxyribonuclease III [bacterium]